MHLVLVLHVRLRTPARSIMSRCVKNIWEICGSMLQCNNKRCALICLQSWVSATASYTSASTAFLTPKPAPLAYRHKRRKMVCQRALTEPISDS